MFYVVTQRLLLTFGSIASVLAYLKLYLKYLRKVAILLRPHYCLVLQGKNLLELKSLVDALSKEVT